jgi:putative ATP-binding cassette transporter
MQNATAVSRWSVVEGIRSLLNIIRGSAQRRRLATLAILIVAIIVATVFAQLRLNTWQKNFYDALAQREFWIFAEQLGVFAVVAGFLLVLNVGQSWINALLRIRMRETISENLLAEWYRPGRAYRMPLAGEIGANPDQRIQDDTRGLTDMTTDFCVGLVQSSLLLASFLGVLWVISDEIVFHANGSTFTIPGYMVWWAIAYAMIGSALTWWVGRPLQSLNAGLRAAEADFRFVLMRTNETSEGIALNDGEASEHRSARRRLGEVIAMTRRLAGRHATLSWVTVSYGWTALVVPFIAAAPAYFSGSLSLGSLVMIAGAFSQVLQALRWYIDNYPNIAAWQALSNRVLAYRDALIGLDRLGSEIGLIEVSKSRKGKLTISEDFSVLCPTGRLRLEAPGIAVGPGERIIIHGPPGCGKSTFFRALSGVWPWGSGRIELPQRKHMMFLPHLPYLPFGSLRELVAHPTPGKFDDAAIRAALESLKLGHRAGSLDVTLRWDRELTLDEQQRIAWIRVLLQKPRWVIEDESMSALDEETRKALLSVFKHELARTAVISVGRDDFHNGFYGRAYRLQVDGPGLKLPLRLVPGEAASQSGASRLGAISRNRIIRRLTKDSGSRSP